MKKIGILNFQYSTHNYGAVLQAAALEHICRQLGHEALHLDYMAKPKVSLKGRIGQLLRMLGLRKTVKANQVGNKEAFERFRRKFIHRTKRINTPKKFSVLAKNFSCIVVGSDQVWRPSYANDILAFFLAYVPPSVDRVAYAASFGTAVWEKVEDSSLTSMVGEELRKFRAVSCREESGVSICKDLFGVDSSHVLDPLLIVDDSFIEKVASQSSVSEPANLIYYKLDATSDFQADLRVLSVAFGADPVNIYINDSGPAGYREVADWLALIKRSKIVITDSYHCICIALRFGKDVIYCPNDRRGTTRLDSLFKNLNIERESIDIELKTPMKRLLKTEDTDQIMELEAERSMRFIADALGG